MFDRLSERFDDLFRSLRGQGRITERNIDDTLRQIRRSLLEADVNFKVAKDFIQRVKEQALGQDVLKSLTPGQQLVKVVHRELVALLGGQPQPTQPRRAPPHRRHARWPAGRRQDDYGRQAGPPVQGTEPAPAADRR